MSKSNYSNLISTYDTFANWLTKTNEIINDMKNSVVTTNSSSTADVTTGNGFVNGYFGANTLYVTANLYGGTPAAQANLNITSNVYISSAATVAANLVITGTANVSSNLTALGVVANNITANNNLTVSNTATVNIANIVTVTATNANVANLIATNSSITTLTVNTTTANVMTIVQANVTTANIATLGVTGLATLASANVTANLNVVGNTSLAQTNVAGNLQVTQVISTSNLISNSTITSNNFTSSNAVLTLANVTTANIATLGVTGLATVVNVSIGTGTSNVQANTTQLTIANPSATATINATSFSGTAANATNLNSQPASFYTNATNITTGTLPWAQAPANTVNTSGAFTITGVSTHNANLFVNVATLSVGNSTVNVTANTTVLVVGNTTANATISTTGLFVVNSTSNVTVNPLSIVMNAGTTTGQVSANATTVAIGNATVNSAVTATGISFNGTLVANSTIYSGTANNSTNLGGISLSTLQTQITSNSANVTNYITTNNYTVTGVITHNANLIVNTANQLLIGNATVNAVANQTTLSISNSTAQLVANPLQITLGNSTVNAVANQTTFFVANSTSSITANAGVLVVGNSTVNVSINSTTFSGKSNNTSAVDGVLVNAATPTDGFVLAYDQATTRIVFKNPSNISVALNANSVVANASLQAGSNGTTYALTVAGNTTSTNVVMRANNISLATDSGAVVFNSNLYVNVATISVGNSSTNVSANTTVLTVGNSTVNVSINSTSFSGTAANATLLGGSTLATIQSQITGNAGTAYTNATNYAFSLVTANNWTSTANLTFTGSNTIFTSMFSANGGLYRITGSGPAYWLQQDGTGRQHWYWNSAGGTSPLFSYANEDASALSMSASANGSGGNFFHRAADGTGKAAGAALTWTTTLYVDINTLTWKGTNIAVANGSTYNLTANNATNFNSQPATFYTNATNITTGTLPWAQAPTNTVNSTGAFTFSSIHTYNANLVVNTANHLIVGNATVNAIANQTTISIRDAGNTATINSSSFSRQANGATYLGAEGSGVTLATLESRITANQTYLLTNTYTSNASVTWAAPKTQNFFGKLNINVVANSTFNPVDAFSFYVSNAQNSAYVFMVNKQRNATHATRYLFSDAGGITNETAGGGFWRGFHIGAPTLTATGPGTISTTLGSNAVTGTSTLFSSGSGGNYIGAILRYANGVTLGTVSTVVSDTSLTLVGAGGASATYSGNYIFDNYPILGTFAETDSLTSSTTRNFIFSVGNDATQIGDGANRTSYGMRFSTGGLGVTRLQIAVNGNIGIACTSPTAALDVTGNVVLSGSGSTITFNSGGPSITLPTTSTLAVNIGSSEAMRISSTRNVGIGTNNPASRLHVASAAGDSARISNDTGSERIHFYSRQAAGVSRIETQNSNNDIFAFDSGYSLNLGTNNAVRMTVTPTGDVGIGRSSAIGAKLDVFNATLLGPIANNFVVNQRLQASTGNAQGLDFLALRQGGATTGAGTITVALSGTAVTGVGTNFTSALIGLQLFNASDVLVGTISAVGSTTSLTLAAGALVAVSGAGYKTSTNDWTTAATRIQSYVDITEQSYIQFNGNNNNHGMSFGTGSSTAGYDAISERMRIDSGGNVAIGSTTTSAARLDVTGGIVRVYGSTFTPAFLAYSQDAVTYPAALIMRGQRTGAAALQSADLVGYVDFRNHNDNVSSRIIAQATETHAAGTASGGALVFQTTNNQTTTQTTRMYISGNGNIGIGSGMTTPAHLLAVNGSIVSINSTSNTTVNPGTITFGGGATVNNTVYSGTANNATNLNSQPASFYTNATNITTGTLPWAQAPTNTVNTSGAFTITGVRTHNANLVVNTANQLLIGNATVNAVANQTTFFVANSTTNTSISSGIITFGGGATVNNTIYSGTANNATNLGGTAAASYQLNSTLAANVATMTANNSTNLGGVAAASYQLNSTLAANVATMTANNSTNLNGVAAASYAQLTAAQTLSSKRIDPRISSAASGDISPDISAADMYVRTALAAATTINAPTGTPLNGNRLMFRLKDNGTARALTWNATYRAVGVTLPTTTVLSKVTYVGAIYNSDETVWDVIAVSTQA